MSKAATKLLVALADATEMMLDQLISQESSHDHVPMSLMHRQYEIRTLREQLEED